MGAMGLGNDGCDVRSAQCCALLPVDVPEVLVVLKNSCCAFQSVGWRTSETKGSSESLS